MTDVSYPEFEIHENPPIQEIGGLTRENPYRPVDWRWKLVLLHSKFPEIKKLFANDPWIKPLIHFAEKLEQSSLAFDPKSILKLNQKYRGLFLAWSFYTKSSYRRIENELKARILAQEDPEQVRFKTRLDQNVIDWYCAGFFDVLDRLDSPSCILHCAILQGREVFDPTSEDVLLPFVGYFFGPNAVDHFVYRAKKEPFSQFLSNLGNDIKANAQLKLWAILNSTDHDKILPIIFKLLPGLQLAERENSEQLTTNVFEALQELFAVKK